jgi:hypothetical protein
MSWSKLELKETLVFRQEGHWYKTKLVKNIKGTNMAEVEHYGTMVMKPVADLPADVQANIAKQIPVA